MTWDLTMHSTPAALLRTFFNQQTELGMPGYVLSSTGLRRDLMHTPVPAATTAKPVVKPTTAFAAPTFKAAFSAPVIKNTPASTASPLSRLKRIGPAALPIVNNSVNQQTPPTVARINTPNRLALKALFDAEKNCTRCSCSSLRIKFAFGAGNADAAIVIIIDAPDNESSSAGLPITGHSAIVLDELLAAVGINKNRDCFITTALKCPASSNQKPLAAELNACEPLLIKQLEIIKPKLIICAGQAAAHLLLHTDSSVTDLRTTTHRFMQIATVVTWPFSLIATDTTYFDQARVDFATAATLLNDLQKEQS